MYFVHDLHIIISQYWSQHFEKLRWLRKQSSVWPHNDKGLQALPHIGNDGMITTFEPFLKCELNFLNPEFNDFKFRIL